MEEWRFDQGRLDYFHVDEVKKIACAIAAIDGIAKPAANADGIRSILLSHSSLPFLPTDYTVWRNYGRVFKCLMLAAEIGGRICATDLCKQIAANPSGLDSDDYLAHFSRRFYYASPIFQGYVNSGIQVFPVVAIIKFLISEHLVRGKRYITLRSGSVCLNNFPRTISGALGVHNGAELSTAAVGACDVPADAVGNSGRTSKSHSMQPLPVLAG